MGEEELEEVVAQVEVEKQDPAEPRLDYHLHSQLDLPQAKQELAMFLQDPNRRESGLVFEHRTVLIGPNFHGSYC